MKKLFYKMIFISSFVLLIPFIISILLNHNNSNFAQNFDFEIIYETNGIKETLSFDQYLTGIVAANMPSGYEMEALKAQAVIARTYALHNISLLHEDNPKKKSFSPSEIGLSFISLVDLEKYWRNENSISYLEQIENAINLTKDQIILYDDSLILPVFFNTGSGFTRNASEAWGIDIPYLISASSKQDLTSTNYLKIIEFNISEVLQLLNTHYPEINILESDFFSEVKIDRRDSIGYVITVSLGNYTISGEEFANILNLDSNNFYLEEYNNMARFICTGSGHGIGLSQYGANIMAKDGSSYIDILKHYYYGVDIVSP